MKTIFLTALIFMPAVCSQGFAQSDPEFPKGFIMHLKLHNGMVTRFKPAVPDLYVGGLQLVAQVTVVPHLLRAGLVINGFYTGHKLQAAFGPTASIKIKTINAGIFGSAANINLSVDHLWGTEHQQLVGGGVNADLANFLVIALTSHYDYGHSAWWFQNSIGIRISKKKRVGGTPEL